MVERWRTILQSLPQGVVVDIWPSGFVDRLCKTTHHSFFFFLFFFFSFLQCTAPEAHTCRPVILRYLLLAMSTPCTIRSAMASCAAISKSGWRREQGDGDGVGDGVGVGDGDEDEDGDGGVDGVM